MPATLSREDRTGFYLEKRSFVFLVHLKHLQQEKFPHWICLPLYYFHSNIGLSNIHQLILLESLNSTRKEIRWLQSAEYNTQAIFSTLQPSFPRSPGKCFKEFSLVSSDITIIDVSPFNLTFSESGVHNSITGISTSCSKRTSLKFLSQNSYFPWKQLFLIVILPEKIFQIFILIFKNYFQNNFSLTSEKICYLKCHLFLLEKVVLYESHTWRNKLVPFSTWALNHHK